MDFERLMLLLNVIKEGGNHGPIYQLAVKAAQQELRDLVEKEFPDEVAKLEARTREPAATYDNDALRAARRAKNQQELAEANEQAREQAIEAARVRRSEDDKPHVVSREAVGRPRTDRPLVSAPVRRAPPTPPPAPQRGPIVENSDVGPNADIDRRL